MNLTLYHYVHCPYCVRVRMGMGFFGLTYKSKVLAYDDEKTPVSLTGKKMLPILHDGNRAINESLDILKLIDVSDRLKINNAICDPTFNLVENYLKTLGENIHSLAMPYWIYTPEFNDSSRSYFQQKKELKRGPFKELVKKRAVYELNLKKELASLELTLKPFFKADQFGFYDIMIAAHLWGLYIVPEFQFSPKMHDYLQGIKEICKFNYHQDFWE